MPPAQYVKIEINKNKKFRSELTSSMLSTQISVTALGSIIAEYSIFFKLIYAAMQQRARPPRRRLSGRFRFLRRAAESGSGSECARTSGGFELHDKLRAIYFWLRIWVK
jgi:hypothetical protein